MRRFLRCPALSPFQRTRAQLSADAVPAGLTSVPRPFLCASRCYPLSAPPPPLQEQLKSMALTCRFLDSRRQVSLLLVVMRPLPDAPSREAVTSGLGLPCVPPPVPRLPQAVGSNPASQARGRCRLLHRTLLRQSLVLRGQGWQSAPRSDWTPRHRGTLAAGLVRGLRPTPPLVSPLFAGPRPLPRSLSWASVRAGSSRLCPRGNRVPNS